MTKTIQFDYPENVKKALKDRLSSPEGLLKHFQSQLSATQLRISDLERDERTYLGIIQLLDEEIRERNMSDN